MSILTLSLDVVPLGDTLTATTIISNTTSRPIRIGGLNLSNLKFTSVDDPECFADPWISMHIPNDNEPHDIPPDENLIFDHGDILSEYEFPAAGEYKAVVVYNTKGFRERFAPDEEPSSLDWLAELEEERTESPEVRFEVSEQHLQLNKEKIDKRRQAFFGDA